MPRKPSENVTIPQSLGTESGISATEMLLCVHHSWKTPDMQYEDGTNAAYWVCWGPAPSLSCGS